MGIFKSKRKKAEELFATGAKGAGTVVQVQDTGMTVNDNPRIKMIFRVEPLDGSPAFDAEKTTMVSRVQIPRQGDRYPVWYDPQNPGKWAYATIRHRPRDDAAALRGRRGNVRRDGRARRADPTARAGAGHGRTPEAAATCVPRACSRTTSSRRRRRSCSASRGLAARGLAAELQLVLQKRR